MNLVKFAILLAIFAALLILFIFLLAVILAMKKKPKIEEGNYKIERIKGKGEF